MITQLQIFVRRFLVKYRLDEVNTTIKTYFLIIHFYGDVNLYLKSIKHVNENE